jgi:hypothetical protein
MPGKIQLKLVGYLKAADDQASKKVGLWGETTLYYKGTISRSGS